MDQGASSSFLTVVGAIIVLLGGCAVVAVVAVAGIRALRRFVQSFWPH